MAKMFSAIRITIIHHGKVQQTIYKVLNKRIPADDIHGLNIDVQLEAENE